MRIVVKIGTNTLTRKNKIDGSLIRDIASQIALLKKNGHEFIIVTSGAIGLGASELCITEKIRDMKLKQAAAAIGQIILMEKYHLYFRKHGLNAAQLLLSYSDFSERKRYLNLRNSLETLLKLNVIPIINENDPVSIDEIGPSFGDNDRLSALVASKTDADMLLILTDVAGLYTKNPKLASDAKIIQLVESITPEIERSAQGTGSVFSVGGMKSKINAAKICMSAGCDVVIAYGREKHVIENAINHKTGTIFVAKKKLSNKRRWILHSQPKGIILLDCGGAKEAMLNNNSLLPAGIASCDGTFEKNDVIEIKEVGKAIVDYSSREIEKIKGKKLSEIKSILGSKGHVVVKQENIVFYEQHNEDY